MYLVPLERVFNGDCLCQALDDGVKGRPLQMIISWIGFGIVEHILKWWYFIGICYKIDFRLGRISLNAK